ncbi:MAG TPA: M48 family metallopeptidase, partial [Vicinamibacteria bacterium]
PPVRAQSNAELAFDEAIAEELEQTSPGSAKLWRKATEAGYRRDLKSARRLYEELTEQEPGFAPGFRTLAGVLLELGERARAIELARHAVELDPAPLNRAALALILARPDKGGTPTEEDIAEALALAQEAAAEAPDELYVQLSLCEVGVLAGDLEGASLVARALYSRGPRTPEVPLCYASVLQAQGDRTRAEQERANAQVQYEEEQRARRAAGGPRKARASDEGSLTDEEALGAPGEGLSLGSLVKWTLAAWVGALGVLLTAGVFLSRAVLDEASRLARRGAAGNPSGGAGLRRAYSGVLWLSCVYYYASIPLLALLTLALGGGILYAMFAVGRVPVKLALVVALLTLATLWSILKSLFVRGRDDDPGERLELRAHPRLRALLEEVARRIETRPVDSVYLTPGTDVAVLERGGLGRQLRGGTERCLVLGVGVLEGFRVGPLKAVLAHEYGHFSNRDTAGGGFALAVRRSLLTMAQGLAESGAAAWYNPVWLFLNGFHRVFLRISQGASRLQEILADRWAVLAYGSKAFEEGLRHVIERSVRFDATASRLVAEMAQRRPVANLY